jgi:hypothetical protein
MKQQFLRFAPFVALMFVGVISIPKTASTAPPPEPHPHIRAAMMELREAREELRTAAHDFCGHRAEAMEKTDQAVKQLQAALACDRR